MQRNLLIGLVLTMIILIFIAVYWATESGRQETAGERQQAETVERGVELYVSNCAVCHGQAGKGLIGPALNNTQLDEDTLEKIIARGRPGTAMSAWGEEDGGPLNRHQIEDLFTFIKNWDSALLEELVAQKVTTPTPTPAPTSTPTPTPDLAAEGRQLFSEKGCIACHKINGQGGEIGPPMAGLFEGERELTTGDRATADREYLKESIEAPDAKVVKGYPEGIMPEVGLSPEQIDALIEFIRSLAK